jgi:hypothetical protein
MGKKAPKPKFQAPGKIQHPNIKVLQVVGLVLLWVLLLGAWCFSSDARGLMFWPEGGGFAEK